MTLRLTRTIGIAAALLATGGALSACGGNGSGGALSRTSADTAAIKAVLTDLQAASRQGDGSRICDQIFTPKLSDSVTASSATGSCAKEVKQRLFSPNTRFSVQSVTITEAGAAAAIVKEASGKTSTVFLVKQSQRWRIRSVTPV
jgi:hypothetical protein